MMIFLIITALTVSIDSFFCGFSLSLSGGKKLPVITGIVGTVFIMCLIANYGASLLSGVVTENATAVGGIILICLGLFNLFNDSEKSPSTGGIIKQSLVSGFAVGLDGALANLSLSLMGINAFYVPVIIAVMHGITIALGVYLADVKAIKKATRLGFLSPLILIVLGAYKLLAVFI